MRPNSLQLVEVGPRDGFQSIKQIIPTEKKLMLIDGLYDAGVRHMEATGFVSQTAVPQLADAEKVLDYAATKPGLEVQVLVPNLRHAERAISSGAKYLAFVLSVSEKHNRGNVRRSPLESAEEYRTIVSLLPAGGKMRLNLATAFDCPFDGPIALADTLELLSRLVDLMPEAEICLCDTTGRATPDRVEDAFRNARARFPVATRWAFHGHDTFGLGVANAVAAWHAGIDVIDASFAGLGGCPFAPGATGNVATEDIVWTFANMKIQTGIDLDALLRVAEDGAGLPGALFGGRVRTALRARGCAIGR